MKSDYSLISVVGSVEAGVMYAVSWGVLISAVLPDMICTGAKMMSVMLKKRLKLRAPVVQGE